MGAVNLDDILPASEFINAVWIPRMRGKAGSFRWMLRFRRVNGMLASGAVIEKRNPGSTRPQLFVNQSHFAEWMAKSDTPAHEQASRAGA
jgi:hypothetical protein